MDLHGPSRRILFRSHTLHPVQHETPEIIPVLRMREGKIDDGLEIAKLGPAVVAQACERDRMDMALPRAAVDGVGKHGAIFERSGAQLRRERWGRALTMWALSFGLAHFSITDAKSVSG